MEACSVFSLGSSLFCFSVSCSSFSCDTFSFSFLQLPGIPKKKTLRSSFPKHPGSLGGTILTLEPFMNPACSPPPINPFNWSLLNAGVLVFNEADRDQRKWLSCEPHAVYLPSGNNPHYPIAAPRATELSFIYLGHWANGLNKTYARVSHCFLGSYMAYWGMMVYFVWVTKLI